MSWKIYSDFSGIPVLNTVINDEQKNVQYFLIDKDRKILFLIKEIEKNEEQKSKKIYKFIVLNYEEIKLSKDNLSYGSTLNKFSKNCKINEIEFGSNIELMKLIIEFESCNPVYQRHFRINKLLK